MKSFTDYGRLAQIMRRPENSMTTVSVPSTKPQRRDEPFVPMPPVRLPKPDVTPATPPPVKVPETVPA